MITDPTAIHHDATRRFLTTLSPGPSVFWSSLATGQRQAPRNAVSKLVYRWLNLFLLDAEPFMSPYWITARQARDAGLKLLPDTVPSLVHFWIHEENAQPALVAYPVYNHEQVPGASALEPPVLEPSPPYPAARLYQDFLSFLRPRLEYHVYPHALPAYDPKTDSVHIDIPTNYKTDSAYYRTCLKLLLQSTAHPSRCNRTYTNHSFRDVTESLTIDLALALLCCLYNLPEVGAVAARIAASQTFLYQPFLAHFPDQLIAAGAAAEAAVDYLHQAGPQDTKDLTYPAQLHEATCTDLS